MMGRAEGETGRAPLNAASARFRGCRGCAAATLYHNNRAARKDSAWVVWSKNGRRKTLRVSGWTDTPDR